MLAAGDEEGGGHTFYELTRMNPQQTPYIPPKE